MVRPCRFESRFRWLTHTALLLLVSAACGGYAVAQAPAGRPTALQCEALTEPLGLDAMRPRLRWKLADGRRGAKQTAYEVMVFSKPPASEAEKADVWESGRVASAVSTGLAYGGPELQPSTRYFWRVRVWDQDGKPYPVSAVSWWETGLLSQERWRGQWIGYELPEQHSLREAAPPWLANAAAQPTSPAETHHDFRFRFNLSQPVARAVLYATGKDTAAAWINGKRVLEAKPLPEWQQLPWGTYATADVTAAVRRGSNLLAVGVTTYLRTGAHGAPTRTPMNAALYVVFEGGSTRLLTSGDAGWKAKLNAAEGWYSEAFADQDWPAAERYAEPKNESSLSVAGRPWPTGPVVALRRSFHEEKAVISARLYATALGAYTFRLNGNRVGDQILAPGWMDFREHVAYQVYDVTREVRQGENAIGAFLAPGWYSTPLEWEGKGNNYGATQPALRAQLRLDHADGSVEWIATDSSWKAQVSPILQAEIYDGETRDARKELTGWDTPGFKDATWPAAMNVAPKEPKIVAQYFPPIRAERVMTARAITSPEPGVYIVDFGQNMAAVPRLRVYGVRGDEVQLRFGEVLNPDGTLYTANLRTAKATDRFILSGRGGKNGVEEFQPEFTFHGFRYAEIRGIRTKPTAETLKAVVLHTDAPFTARFSSGDVMVNQLWSNILWGQRSNFVGVPTDCPQRDERLGWSADAQVFWRTATFNMDLTTFSRKYAADLHGTQEGTAMYGIFAPGVATENPGYGAAWSDAGVIVPWTGWVQSGDSRIVDENWDGMVRYLAELERKNPDHLWRHGFGDAFGDWLTPTITTPEDLLATAYWAYDATLMRQMAQATGHTAEVQRYQAIFEAVRTAFQKAYVGEDGFVGAVDRYPSIPPPTTRPGAADASANKPVETQTGYVLALHMNLLPQEMRARAADRLVAMIAENHWLLGTGFLGTPYLLEVLSETGHSEVAYRLLLNRDYPSWGYLIDHGATTMWERWNGDTMRGDPSMNSYNHYAYGAVAEWICRYGAGIDTTAADAGFHTIRLHPNFDARLGHMSLEYDSGYGTIRSAWMVRGGRVEWDVTVPANTTAMLATGATGASEFQLKGVALGSSSELKAGAAAGEFVLQAGQYRFTATLRESRSGGAVTTALR